MMLACHKGTDDEAGACYMHSDRSLDIFMHYLSVLKLNSNLRLEGGFPTFFNDQIRSFTIHNFLLREDTFFLGGGEGWGLRGEGHQ